MVKTIFRNTFLVGLSVLLLCALLFFGMQYTEVTEETLSFLKEEAVYVEKGVLLGGQHYLESLQGTERVTWTCRLPTTFLTSGVPSPSKSSSVFFSV